MSKSERKEVYIDCSYYWWAIDVEFWRSETAFCKTRFIVCVKITWIRYKLTTNISSYAERHSIYKIWFTHVHTQTTCTAPIRYVCGVLMCFYIYNSYIKARMYRKCKWKPFRKNVIAQIYKVHKWKNKTATSLTTKD